MSKRSPATEIITLLLLSGCEFSINIDGREVHFCDSNFIVEGDWSQGYLELHHSEPRDCPVSISGPYEPLVAAGEVRDHNESYVVSRLEVLNTDGVSAGAPDEEPFQQGDGYVYAQMRVDFLAATGSSQDYDVGRTTSTRSPKARRLNSISPIRSSNHSLVDDEFAEASRVF